MSVKTWNQKKTSAGGNRSNGKKKTSARDKYFFCPPKKLQLYRSAKSDDLKFDPIYI